MGNETSLLQIILTQLGGSTVVIIGLIVFLKQNIQKRIMTKIETENKIIFAAVKQEFEKELKHFDQFSEITKETYQNFFEKRLDVYQELIMWKNEFDSIFEDKDIIRSREYGERIIRSYEKLKPIITKNYLYISTKLEESYEKLFLEFRGYYWIDKLAEDEIDVKLIDHIKKSNNKDAGKIGLDIFGEFIGDLRYDIRNLRSRIDIDSNKPQETQNETE